VNAELTMLSKFIAKKIHTNNKINDFTPHSISAGIIYFVAYNCNLNIAKSDIKAVCGVSEVTTNKCFRKLEEIKSDLLPTVILEKYGIK
jgi:transcription initiation factor TFIIIB Brf1 subunit/transcription initiation factor TFIIB